MLHAAVSIHPLGWRGPPALTRLTPEENRSDHITELNSARPKQPFFFLKPASSIVPPGAGPVIRPKGVDLHFEVELALIIGKQLRDLQASDEKAALDAVESEPALAAPSRAPPRALY